MDRTTRNASLPTPFFKDKSYWAFWIRDANGKRKPQYLMAGTDEERTLAKAGGKPAVTEAVLMELAKVWRVATLQAGQTPAEQVDVASIITVYLNSKYVKGLNSFRAIRRACEEFRESYGKMLVCDVRGHHVRQWVDSHPTWTRTNGPVKRIKTCFAWAVQEGLIPASPLAGEKCKLVEEDVIDRHTITEAEEEAILAKLPKHYLPLFRFLMATGCRPGEAIGMTIEMSSHVHGGIIFTLPKHKTSKKGKTRRIYCTGEAEAIVRAAMDGRKSGHVFLNKEGRGFGLFACQDAIRTLRDKGVIPESLTLYSARHTYITRFLMQGGTIEVCAQLVGNTPAVLDKHYNHLAQHGAFLMSQAELARKPVEAEPTILPMTRAV